jgi:hypothetical protein
MKSRANVAVIALVALTLAVGAYAQMQMGMSVRVPQMKGFWNPVVGSGAAYEIQTKESGKTKLELAIVGTETVDGKPGFWLETKFKDPRSGDDMYTKNLTVADGKERHIVRVIMQMPDQPPMEMPMEMINRGRQSQQEADLRETSELVGSESVTTPAGTFTCDHYRAKDGSADTWVAQNVSPWGLVKHTGKDSSMVLTKVITNAKSHIVGTPVKFDPAEMMRPQMERQP